MKASMILHYNQQAYTDNYRVVANIGGTRSGKTYAILQLLLTIAVSGGKQLISVVSESFPHLYKGAIRDFENILNGMDAVEGRDYAVNKSNHIYYFKGGGKIEFFSTDNAGKVHGAQRDILFINECNHIQHEIYRQLAVRTSGIIFLDWNPIARFWFEDKGIETMPTTKVIRSTYKDNPFLSATQIAEIESNKSDEAWWRVYGLGETGSVEGLIYTRWDIVQQQAPGRRAFYCIDFGFTNDPTAILYCTLQGGELYVDELAYGPGMSNAEIAKVLKDHGATRGCNIVADSAEPKSIAEINGHGLHVVPATKGAGSITAGIGAVQAYQLHITARSLGIIQELRNYMWKRDQAGEWINTPIDKYNHALDALRYGVTKFLWTKGTRRLPGVRLTRTV